MSQPDEEARIRIAGDLGSTLFVEAGAGSGKTKELVTRVVNLLLSGAARIDQVAAITFTEAAAAELRDRLAEALEERADSVLAVAALDGLEGAAVTTLHGFARRVLSEHAFAAGLPPIFEVADEQEAEVDFDLRWPGIVERHLVADEAFQRAIACGVSLDALKRIARRFEDNWERLPTSADRPRGPVADPAAVLRPLEAARALASNCTDAGDRLLAHLERLGPWIERLDDCGSEVEVLAVLAGLDRKLTAGNAGQAAAWGGCKPEVRDLLAAAQLAVEETLATAASAALRSVGCVLADLTVEEAGARRSEGLLHFHDLLVLARDLVRSDRRVQRALHDQYRFILVDELQDTDPIQIELAVRIASSEPAGPEVPWQEIVVDDGHLFFVGDPKQSIYRFRRADIELFHEAKATADPVQLTSNFRSVPGVLAWIDAVCGELMGEDYVPSAPSRPPAAPEPPVVVVDGHEEEATGVATAVLAARNEGWPVGDAGRPAMLSDITVLVPTRTTVPDLERAFDDVGIPYRLESSSLVYSAPEVCDLLTILRAVDDPTDAASVVGALRSPGFGCGDDDLLRHRTAGGSWDYRVPSSGEGPVGAALDHLRTLHEERWWLDVSTLVTKVVGERCLLPLALDRPRWREVWRRIRYVVDQARRFSERTPGDLRRFLRWTDTQRDEDARVTEPVLPEGDLDAVRVMTIHAAKGLEFPIVVVAGLGTGPPPRRADVLFGPMGPELYVRKGLATAGYAALAEHEALLSAAERLRLFYVAATRARDHLVVSVGDPPAESLAGLVKEACSLCPQLWRTLQTAPSDDAGSDDAGSDDADPVVGDERARSEWVEAYRRRMGSAARPMTVAATGVAVEDPPERPAWRRGRAGTAVGRAVHATLQVVDLATGDGVAAVAAANAGAEGVPGRAAEVERLARAAIESEVVRRAVAAGRYWRELYVGIPVEGRVLEGIVDLLVDGRDGLEVVDYKTDKVASDEELDRAVAEHRLQAASYALAVEGAVGRPVERCTLLFLRESGALSRTVGDLAAAMAEVRHFLDR